MQIVIVTVIAYTDATVLDSVCGVILGRRCIAFTSLSDTTPYGLMALKGALAAAGSAQRGEQ